MSEWFDVTNQDDVDLSDDGKEVHILFATNRNGNRYVSVPVEVLVKLLSAQLVQSGAPTVNGKLSQTVSILNGVDLSGSTKQHAPKTQTDETR